MVWIRMQAALFLEQGWYPHFESFYPFTVDGRQSHDRFHGFNEPQGYHQNELWSQRIFDRGWIMQERLLCPRMLSFVSRGMFWECAELDPVSESIPNGLWQLQKRETPYFFSVDGEHHSSSDRLYIWQTIIESYSKMGLSYPKEDKFVAISGIARRMAELMDDSYVAGMFEKGLVQDLCWSALEGERPAAWRAPSWSWASIDGAVKSAVVYSGKFTERLEMIFIERWDVQLEDPRNSYGSLKSAWLELRGLLLPVDLRVRTYDFYNTRRELAELSDSRPTYDAIEAQFPSNIGKTLPAVDTLRVWADDDEKCQGDLLNPRDTSFAPQCYLLPVIWNFNLVNNPTGEEIVHCLVLKKISHRRYLRLGYARACDEQAEWIRATWEEDQQKWWNEPFIFV